MVLEGKYNNVLFSELYEIEDSNLWTFVCPLYRIPHFYYAARLLFNGPSKTEKNCIHLQSLFMETEVNNNPVLYLLYTF